MRQIKICISKILKINRYHATYERVATQNQHVSTKYQTHLKQKVKLNILRVLPNLALPEEVAVLCFELINNKDTLRGDKAERLSCKSRRRRRQRQNTKGCVQASGLTLNDR